MFEDTYTLLQQKRNRSWAKPVAKTARKLGESLTTVTKGEDRAKTNRSRGESGELRAFSQAALVISAGAHGAKPLGTLSYSPTSMWAGNPFPTFAVDHLTDAAPAPPVLSHDALIVQHLPTVRFLAKKLQRTLPEHVELDELIAAGTLGLVDAATRFHPESGVLFGTFAQFRIRGAMLDSLRDTDWAPRELRRKSRTVEDAIQRATRRLGRRPEETEVAAELGLALSDYQALLGELDGLEIGSLHVVHGEDSAEEEIAYVPGAPEDDPLFQCLRSELKGHLISAIDALPERERLVLTLYYYEELTLKEIGHMLHLAESRISQIRSAAILKLRSTLRQDGPFPAAKSRALKSAA